jgi:hypothetical protein
MVLSFSIMVFTQPLGNEGERGDFKQIDEIHQ